jgi:predicted site-specific integrase-resolvase
MSERTKAELMTVAEVLDVLNGVSRRTFNRWRELGVAPQAIKLPNGQLRIRRRDLADWLHEHEEFTA